MTGISARTNMRSGRCMPAPRASCVWFIAISPARWPGLSALTRPTTCTHRNKQLHTTGDTQVDACTRHGPGMGGCMGQCMHCHSSCEIFRAHQHKPQSDTWQQQQTRRSSQQTLCECAPSGQHIIFGSLTSSLLAHTRQLWQPVSCTRCTTALTS